MVQRLFCINEAFPSVYPRHPLQPHLAMPAALLSGAFVLPPPPAVEFRAFTHGLMPRTVEAMMNAFVDDWQQHGVDAWNHVPNHWRPLSGESVGWWTLPTYLGDHFIAPLLRAPRGACIMQPSVHGTVQSLLSAPEPWQQGKHVVVDAGAFPSVLHSVQRWQPLLGLEVEIIPAGDDGFVDQQAILQAIREDTAMVFLSHVGFATGERLPDSFMAETARRLHLHGGLLAIDGYHATAQMVLDVSLLGADVYFGGLLKEGCGSSGNAYVYIRPGLDLTPCLTGWFGDADPFGFAQAPSPHPEVRQRFLGGTTAVASLYHSVEGLRALLDCGLDCVEAHVHTLGDEAVALAHALGIPLASPVERARRGAMIVLSIPDAYRVTEYLKTQHIYADSRRDEVIRLAPFVWNSSDDVERFFHALVDTLRTGAYLTLPLKQAGPVT